MKKLHIFLLLLLIAAGVCRTTQAWEKQTLYVLNNYLSYGTWPQEKEPLGDYYYRVWRDGRWYRTYTQMSEPDITNQEKWQIVGGYGRNVSNSYYTTWAMLNIDSNPHPSLTYHLGDAELDFAGRQS